MACDSHIFVRFARGGDCTTQRAKRIGQWFSDHWPDDLDWPEGVARPEPTAPARRGDAA